MYDSRYSAENRVGDTQIAIDAAIDEDRGPPSDKRSLRQQHDPLRAQARDQVENVTPTRRAHAANVLTSISQISQCMGSLQSQGLSDRLPVLHGGRQDREEAA